jgi:predicted nucleic acid-binding protein
LGINADALDAFLENHRSIGIDTSVVIYAVEAHPRYLLLAQQIFRWARGAKGNVVTSTITMTEALVKPYRQGDVALIQEFHALLATYPHLDWVAPNLHIADRAAQIRADHNLRTPDAIQAATAMATGVRGFITNDPVFRRIPSLEVLVLHDLL